MKSLNAGKRPHISDELCMQNHGKNDSTVNAKKLVKMQWINAVQILHQII